MHNINTLKDELQYIFSGKSQIRCGELIYSIACYLRAGQSPSEMAGEDKYFKKEETKRLVEYINEHHLWVDDINEDNFLSEGAEQKVYIKDGKTVIK